MWKQLGFLAAFGLTINATASASAAPLLVNQLPGVMKLLDRSAEPFDLPTLDLPEGPLQAKWQEAQREIRGDLQIAAACEATPSSCTAPEVQQFLAIVAQAQDKTGLARLGEINRQINLAIRHVSDFAQYGVEDRWTSPLASLKAGAGDCEDYAIAKYAALRQAGIPDSDMRLVIMRNDRTQDDHAVLAVHIDDDWRILDNRSLVMVKDRDLNHDRPMFAFNADGAKRFADPTMVMAGAPVRPAPTTSLVEDILLTEAL